MSKPQQGYDDPRLDAEFRAWAECTGSMLSRHRLDGTFTYVSPACRAVLGWEPEEIVGRKLKSLLHPDDALMMVAEFGQLPPHGRPASATFRLLRKDGTHLWVEVTAGITTSAADGGVEIISILRDVSDRQSIDNLVRRAQEILPSLFDRLPVVIVFLDPDGQIHYVNRYCESLFGWPLEDLRRPEIWQQMYADAETRARIQTWARQPAKEIVDVRTRTKAGASVVIRWAGVKLGDGGSIAIGVDISERIAAEEALRESEARVRHLNEQLLATDQRKNEFLAMLAHELRNPLAPIANAVEALIRRGTDDADLARACELIQEKVRHLVRLVDDLLDASRLDNDVIRIELAVCEIGDVLREALSTSQPLFERAGHRLSVDLGATPLWLRGDRIRLVQVFSNLLNNAAAFTPPGGDVSLSVGSEGDFAVVRVRDSGHGIGRRAAAAGLRPVRSRRAATRRHGRRPLVGPFDRRTPRGQRRGAQRGAGEGQRARRATADPGGGRGGGNGRGPSAGRARARDPPRAGGRR